LITRLLLLAAAALVALVVWEVRRADPIVDLRPLADRNFAAGNLLMFVLGFTLLGTTVLLPLYAQTMLGYTATAAGLVLSPGGFALLLLMPAVGALSAKIDVRWLIALGLSTLALALYSMTRFDAGIDFATLAWARVYQSVSLALLFIPINIAGMAAMPAAKSNNAAAIINMTRNIGGSVGVSLATTLIARREQFHQHMLAGDATPFRQSYAAFIARLQGVYLHGAASAADALHMAQAKVYAMVRQEAALLAFNDAFRVMALILAALVPLALLLRRPPRSAGPGAAH
jgi:DHA2 family multidrug resistance protein